MRIRGKWHRSIIVVLLILLSAALCTACGGTELGQQSQQTQQSLHIQDVVAEPETLPPVQVEMPEYTLTYSGKLKDVIIHRELEGENALEFQVKLSKTEAHIFTLRFDSTEGEFVTVLKDADGNQTPVAFQMTEIPDNLSEEDKNVFLTAQEAVNEIASSLVLKK